MLLCSGSAVPVYYVRPFPFLAFYSFAFHVGVTVRVALALGASYHALSGGLAGHLGPLVCCVRLTAGFYSRWSCSLLPCHGSSMCLAHQAQVSVSHNRLPCLHRREFLPASVRGLSAADDLFTCGACGFYLSCGGRYHLLQAPRSSFSLRSPQYMVAVASRSSSTSSSFLGHLGSPPCSPRRSLLRIAVHHPLLPLTLLSGCGFTLPLPLRPCCLLAHRMAGFKVVSLAWLFFLLLVIGFSYSWSLLVVRLHALGTFPLAVSPVTHSSLTVPIALGEFSFFSS